MIQSAMHHNYDYFKNNERDAYLQNATDELEHFIGILTFPILVFFFDFRYYCPLYR